MALKGTPTIPKNKVRSATAMLQDEHCDTADAKRVSLVTPDGLHKVDVIQDSKGIWRLAVDGQFTVEGDVDVSVDIANPTTCEMQNHTVVTANSEFSLDLPDGTKRYNISVRDCGGVMRVACNAGETSSDYKKVPLGVEYTSGPVDLPNSSKVYLQVNKAGVVVELESWFV